MVGGRVRVLQEQHLVFEVWSRDPPPSADLVFIFCFSSCSWLGRHFFKLTHLIICSTHRAEVSLSFSLQHHWGGYRVMIRSTDDSIGCWSAALQTQTAPSSSGSNMISDSWFLNSNGKNSSGGSRERLKFKRNNAERGGGGRPNRKSLKNQTMRSNGCRNIQGVIYGLEKMALLERCHAWAVWFTVMSAALMANVQTAEMRPGRLKPPLIMIMRRFRLCVLPGWCFFKYITPLTLLNGMERIGSFCMCNSALMSQRSLLIS